MCGDEGLQRSEMDLHAGSVSAREVGVFDSGGSDSLEGFGNIFDQIFGVLSRFTQSQMNNGELGLCLVRQGSSGGEVGGSFLRIVGDGARFGRGL